MTKLSAKDYKAIAWYCKDRNLRPELSTPPVMYFTRKTDGEKIDVNLGAITREYSVWNDEDKKERAREKKALAAKQTKRLW